MNDKNLELVREYSPFIAVLDIESSEQTSLNIPVLHDGAPLYDKSGNMIYKKDGEGNNLHPSLMYSACLKVLDTTETEEIEYISPADMYDIKDAEKNGTDLEELDGVKVIRKTVKQFKTVKSFRIRSNNDFKTVFQSLNNLCDSAPFRRPMKGKKKGQSSDIPSKMIVYVHNLSFDAFQLIRTLSLDSEIAATFDPFSFIAKSASKIVQIGYSNICFRCSLELLGSGIKKLGKNAGVYKLHDDYHPDQSPETLITAEQWEYNERDIDIMNIALCNELNSWEFIECIDDVPPTRTGIGRLANKKSKKVNYDIPKLVYEMEADGKTYKRDPHGRKIIARNADGSPVVKMEPLLKGWRFKCMYDYPESIQEYQLAFDAYQGGIVFSPLEEFRNVNYNVHSFDVASEYPSTSSLFLFRDKRIQYNGKYILEGDEANKQMQAILCDPNNVAFLAGGRQLNNRPFFQKIGFDAVIEIENLRIKKTVAGNCLPFLRLSTACQHIGLPVHGARLDSLAELYNLEGEAGNNNGKVMHAKHFLTTVDEWTLLGIMLFYDFDSITCHRAQFWTLSQPHEYLISLFHSWGDMKAKCKLLTKLCKKGQVTDPTNKILTDALEGSLLTPEEFVKLPQAVQQAWSQETLQQYKGLLNGQYGINVEKLLRDCYSVEGFESGQFDHIEKGNRVACMRIICKIMAGEYEAEMYQNIIGTLHDGAGDGLASEIWNTIPQKRRDKLEEDGYTFYDLIEDLTQCTATDVFNWLCNRCLGKEATTDSERVLYARQLIEGGLNFLYFDTDKKSLQKKQLNRSFYVGKTIANASKYIVLNFAYNMLCEGARILYMDTDSVKVTDIDKDKALAVQAYFNKMVKYNQASLFLHYDNPVTEWEMRSNRCAEMVANMSSDAFKFGQMEYEDTYKEFSTMGAKDYCYTVEEEDGSTSYHWTKAGLPGASKKFEILCKNRCGGDFSKWVRDYYHPNLVFSPEISGSWDDEAGTFSPALMHYTTNEVFKYRFQDGTEMEYYSAPILRPMSKRVNSTTETDTQGNEKENTRMLIACEYLKNIGLTERIETRTTLVTATELEA